MNRYRADQLRAQQMAMARQMVRRGDDPAKIVAATGLSYVEVRKMFEESRPHVEK